VVRIDPQQPAIGRRDPRRPLRRDEVRLDPDEARSDPGALIGSGEPADLVRTVITGGGGSDIIDAGRGADIVFAGYGDDRVLGKAGRDVLTAGPGTDTVRGGRGFDQLDGGGGEDACFLGPPEPGHGTAVPPWGEERCP
jgi:hypothetical protein